MARTDKRKAPLNELQEFDEFERRSGIGPVRVEVLTTWDGHPVGKAFRRAADGSVEKLKLNLGKWFHRRAETIESVADLHHKIAVPAMERGNEISVTGGALNPWKDGTTRGLHVGDLPTPEVARTMEPRIADIPSRYLPLDVEHVPILAGISPVDDPRGAFAEFDTLLPPALRRAAKSVAYSGSTAITNHDEFRIRLLMLTSQPVRQAERYALHDALNRYVIARLKEVYGLTPYDPKAKEGQESFVIDRSLGSANQPVYSARPHLDGVGDPFGDRRAWLVPATDGGPDEIDLDALITELEAAGAWEEPRSSKPKKAKQPGEAKAPKPRALRTPLPRRTTARVIDIKTAKRLMDARNRARRTVGEERRDACFRVGAIRAVAELVDAVADRRTWMPGWERGIPHGRRSTYLYAVAAEIVLADPKISRDALEARLREVGRHMVDIDWLERWLAKRAYVASWNRAQRHNSGERVAFAGEQANTPMYTHRMATLCALWDVSEDEALRLGFLSLCPTDTIRRRNARYACGAVKRSREDYEGASLSTAKPWEAAGVSRATWYRRRAEQEVVAAAEAARLRSEAEAARPLPRGRRGSALALPRIKAQPVAAPAVPAPQAAVAAHPAAERLRVQVLTMHHRFAEPPDCIATTLGVEESAVCAILAAAGCL